jgi:acetyl-CoA synthetase
VGGVLNASVNCLDRHLPERADQVAVHWEGEPGDRRTITYGALHAEVVTFADALRGLGVEPGDRVGLHLGWIPETVVAMLACARLGAVHSVLPASLPADALADRLSDLGPKVLVTQDGAFRHGLIVPSKNRADEALAAAAGVEATVVVRRVGVDVAWYEGDRWYHDLVAAPRPGSRKAPAGEAGEPALVEADHPLLIVPLAHRRGRPTWIVHRTGGYLVAAATVHRRALTARPDDVFWCAAEIAWIGGQSHGVYGPLACGATTVMSEGTLDVPTRSRAWQIIERYGVNALVTTPSVMRNLRQWVDTPPAEADLSSLRLIVTLGERIDPETRNWLDFEVGGGRALVANAWGQTELAGLVAVSPAPAPAPADPSGPSTAAVPDPGLEVVDSTGRPAGGGGRRRRARPAPPLAGGLPRRRGRPRHRRRLVGPLPRRLRHRRRGAPGGRRPHHGARTAGPGGQHLGPAGLPDRGGPDPGGASAPRRRRRDCRPRPAARPGPVCLRRA